MDRRSIVALGTHGAHGFYGYPAGWAAAACAAGVAGGGGPGLDLESVQARGSGVEVPFVRVAAMSGISHPEGSRIRSWILPEAARAPRLTAPMLAPKMPS